MLRVLRLGRSFARFPQSAPAARMTHSSTRGYAEAITALNSLQSPAEQLDRQRASRGRCLERAGREMAAYLHRVELAPADLNALRAVHVAGTKGKGSTCAFVERLLREKGRKTGLFSSPHLMEVRERIRIDGAPLSRASFARYFWLCWDLFEKNKARILWRFLSTSPPS